MRYRKHFIPLESNPELFTQLIHRLGVSTSLQYHDVLSLDDPELLALVPRPALALVLVFPTSPSYKSSIAGYDQTVNDYTKFGDQEEVMWYRQTINNACGLYGILHAVSNGQARDHIVPHSHLFKLVEKCKDLGPKERAAVLEEDEELELAYEEVALQGDSEAPENPEDEVDFHYVCFVRSHKDGHIYELDGDRKAPVNWGASAENDMLAGKGLGVIKQFTMQVESDTGFSLLALSPT
ncbi:ubiquitinyl hydrolase 1 [Diatrype stigma]|uniref:Ubiquitin carboxyl-terminal hydrolase n=1 Tax=Diatrype stigma TaxID=117547 RepID=A0AAN9YPT7_9PEZI